MVTVQSISEYDKLHATAITIGTFDGVHIGHRKILERLTKNSTTSNLKSTVLTFFPHPRMVLQKDTNIKLLNTVDEKIEILQNIGIDQLIIHPFTKEFSRLSATEFVRDILVNSLKTKKIIIGYDHHFGRNRNANINDLRAFGNALDFEVEEIPAQEINAVSVSSTKIRRALDEGDIGTANKYLGYHYMLTGSITKGKGLGRQLGYPTANILIEEPYKLVPRNGVYVVQAALNDRVVHGMMNIGQNPTVSDAGNETQQRPENIEVHFFDVDQDLYGKKIQVDMLKRIRDEHKFDSVDALKRQLHKDKETALAFISN